MNDAGFDAIDSINEGGIWNQFHEYLKPKTNIIGWHNSWNKTEYLNYNYAYLSAINLYGFELSASGKSRNPDDLKEFLKEQKESINSRLDDLKTLIVELVKK